MVRDRPWIRGSCGPARRRHAGAGGPAHASVRAFAGTSAARINAFRSEWVDLLTLFEYPTIAQLATHLAEPVPAVAAPERRVRPVLRRRRTAR